MFDIHPNDLIRGEVEVDSNAFFYLRNILWPSTSRKTIVADLNEIIPRPWPSPAILGQIIV